MRTFLPLLFLLLFFAGCLAPSKRAHVEEASDESLELATNACVTADISPLTPWGIRVPGMHIGLIFDLFLDSSCASADLVQVVHEVTATDLASSDWNNCGNGTIGGRRWAKADKWELWEGGAPGSPTSVSQINDDTDLAFMATKSTSCDTDGDGDYDAVPLRRIIFSLSSGSTGNYTFTGDTEFSLWVDTSEASASSDDKLTVDAVKIIVDSGNGNEEVGNFLPVLGEEINY